MDHFGHIPSKAWLHLYLTSPKKTFVSNISFLLMCSEIVYGIKESI